MPLDPDAWARIKDVFAQARPLPVAARQAFLSATCAGEPDVQRHVERLLAADQLAGGFLQTPAALTGDGATDETLECQEIGGYEITSLIGAGGMGEVYKAYDRRLDRHVAVKALPVYLTSDAEWLRRFRAEARAASSLNHPHILVVHDIGDFDGRPYIVMEFVEGQTLRERIKSGPVTVQEAISAATQVASALTASHARGIVHRDIKPDNVMLRPDGYIKVLDFGLARQIVGPGANTTAETRPGALVGTLRYMSPEQSRGDAVHAPSDVFSLGLLLFEMLTGRHPFHAESSIGVLHGIQSHAPPSSGAGPELDDLLQEMLHKNPAARPTAANIVTRLNGLVSRAPVVDYVPRHRTSVGRERERAELRAAFEMVDRGHGQFVAVSGEPGIGKSTLVDDFLAEIASPLWIGRGRCSERLGGAEAHLPFLEALESLMTRDPVVAPVMKQVAPSWYVHIAPLSPEDSSAARLLADTKTGSAERMMREMAALLVELARLRPVVLFIDDVHWADVSTVDLLGFLAPKLADFRALLLVTYRPTDLTIAKHPFLRLKSDLTAHRSLHEVSVAFLTEQDVARYVAAQLPDTRTVLSGLIYRKTEGNPLFMVDLVRYLRERDGIEDWTGEIERNIPESLRGMIDRNLERLDDRERQLLRVAAVQGFEFDSAIVASVIGCDPADVEDALQSLDRIHGLVQLLREQGFPNRTFSLRYQFVHVLYQSALYSSIAPSRKAGWSSKVAGALEEAYADRKRVVASELALLYEMAREPWRASEYFLAASEVASSRFATREALAFARRGLACLTTLPSSHAVETRELALQKALLHPMAMLEGYGTPATERVSQRIIELAERLEEHGSLFAALDGAAIVHMVRGECLEAALIADRMLTVARHSSDEVQEMNARMWAMLARHHLGELRAAQAHADACIRMGQRSNQRARLTTLFDPIVATLAESSRNLWMLGDVEGCLTRARNGLMLANEIAHPNSLSFGLLFHGWMHGHQEHWDVALESTEEGLALCSKHGLLQTMAWHHCVHGWTLAHTGKAADGLAELQSGIEDSARIMGHVAMPHFLAMLAEVLIVRREHARALDEVERILVVNERTRDEYFNAELYRLAGECYLALDDPATAETTFERAFEIARRQEALTFQLRAALSLGRLWAAGSETGRARALVRPILDSLERFDESLDVHRARTAMTEWTTD